MSSVDYLVRHVAAADGRATGGEPAATVSPLTRYYTAGGYPPGRWLGSGLASLAGGEGVAEGSEVSEAQMRAVFEDSADPVNGASLMRRAPASYPSRAERIDRRVRRLVDTLPVMSAEQSADAIEKIREEERRNPGQRTVHGFDLTFKPVKSVSTLWALADHGIQVQLFEAHHAAVATTLARVEGEVLRTRIGAQGVRRVRTRGLIAAAFDHWDSRAGDPLLHTHVTVANRVQGEDGVWRTIDSRSFYKATVALSESYDAALADEVTRRLGIGWERRARGAGRRDGRELASVPAKLCAEFSSRSADIEQAVAVALEEYRTAHGGAAPSQAVLWRIRQQQTLATRSGKHITGLDEAIARWTERASAILGRPAGEWAAEASRAQADRPVLLRRDDISAAAVESLGARVVDVVASKRAQWGEWNLDAEASRQIVDIGWQFVDPDHADAVRRLVVARAVAVSVAITSPELASVPDRFRDPATGASEFAPPATFTSAAVLAAEDRLVELADDTAGPAVGLDRALAVAEQPLPGRSYALDAEDQTPAALDIAGSGRVVDVLVGPAGTGKTTTMAGVRAIWESEFGAGAVVGLATSSKAAEALAADLGIATDNTAQWLAQQRVQPQRAERLEVLRARRAAADGGSPTATALDTAIESAQADYNRWRLRPGQLLIVDEAGMAGTFALRALADQVAASGAKLLLVGDPHQLSPVETGGAFGMLVHHRADAPQLHVIRRFAEPDGSRRRWEEEASLGLRTGRLEVIDTYNDHGRLHDGDRTDMLDAAYRAWQTDTAAGRASILIAGDNGTVRELAERARADRIAAGEVDPTTQVALHDGLAASRGDHVVTREINRYLQDGTTYAPAGRSGRRSDGYVKNGQRWLVDQARPDGSLTVRMLGTDNQPTAASVTLPAWYAAEHVELGYAATAHRSQGITVDTAHTIADEMTARELLYVAMTRGRFSNHTYLVIERAGGDAEDQHGPPVEPWTPRDLLCQILHSTRAELSARETITQLQDEAESLRRLVPEYETLAAAAHELAAADLLHTTGLPNAAELVADPEFGQIATAIRSAHQWQLSGDALRRHLADNTPVPVACGDVAEQIRRWTAAQTAGRSRPTRRLIGGIVPDASAGLGDGQFLTAMTERATLIESRVERLAERAVISQPAWLKDSLVGKSAQAMTLSPRSATAVRQVVAYRDRWNIEDPRHPLGPRLTASAGISQRMDRRHAERAVLAAQVDQTSERMPDTPTLVSTRGHDR
ncbi:MobF family relaxase [Nakamurella lactea]|uniref:MobF family relaxase n=1 Tax=Nakamurella lactea TaxID=459515 RepID=UPI001377F5AF|nr:MobF family relaxase [Nakamurella lactea]